MGYEKLLAKLDKAIQNLQEAQESIPLDGRIKAPEAYILGCLKINYASLLETKKIVEHTIETRKNRIKSSLEPPENPQEPS